jgi:opacity protein-like surface antigen
MKTPRLGILARATMAGAALVAAVAGSVQAADMPVKAPPAPVPVYTWTGFYGGINGGYGWSDRTITFTPGDPFIQGSTCGGIQGGTCALPASSKLQGGFGGLQAGTNWQVNPFFLAGLEVLVQLYTPILAFMLVTAAFSGAIACGVSAFLVSQRLGRIVSM